MGDRLSSLGDDNFFALTDSIEELNDFGGSFRERDVGDHGVDLLYDRFFNYEPWGKGNRYGKHR